MFLVPDKTWVHCVPERNEEKPVLNVTHVSSFKAWSSQSDSHIMWVTRTRFSEEAGGGSAEHRTAPERDTEHAI